jgi:hypothetical protein
MQSISEGCAKNLQTLKVSGCAVTDAGVIAVLDWCMSLRHLDVSECDVSDLALDAAARRSEACSGGGGGGSGGGRLHVSASACGNGSACVGGDGNGEAEFVTDDGSNSVGSGCSGGGASVSGSGGSDLGRAGWGRAASSALGSISSSVIDSGSGTRASTIDFGTAPCGLTHLDIHQCNCVTAGAVVAAASRMAVSLRVLNVYYCRHVDYAVYTAVRQAHPRLTVLHQGRA